MASFQVNSPEMHDTNVIILQNPCREKKTARLEVHGTYSTSYEAKFQVFLFAKYHGACLVLNKYSAKPLT